MTKIEQKIPEGWSVKKLKDLSTKGIFNGIFNDPKKVGRGVPLINVVDLYQDNINFSNLSLLDVTENELDKYEAKEGDLLFTRSSLKLEGIAHCNLVKKYSERVVYDCHLMRVRTNQALAVPYYLYTFCNTKMTKQNFMSNAKTTTMTTIDQKGLGNVLILLPPLPEQEKIAEILSCWDDGIEKLSALIEKKKIQKKALMQQLLTGKHRLKGFKEPWIDVDLASILQYEQPSKYLVDEVLTYNKNKISVLTANKAFILGSTNDTEGVYNKGDCIIFDDFTTDIKYVDFPFKIKSSAIKILTPLKAETNLKFVFEQMKRIKYPLGGHKRYYLSEFQYLPISLPCPAEQKAIAEILSKADEEIELLNKKLEAFKQEKKALMQQLLTGKIRVKVN